MSLDFFREFENLGPDILESKIQVIDKLSIKMGAQAKAGDTRVFFQNWQPFAYACILGILEEKKVHVEATSNDKINRDKFKYLTIKRNGPDILNSIILSIISINNKGIKLLANPQEMNKEISAYANYGFEILDEQITSGELTYITGFINQIASR